MTADVDLRLIVLDALPDASFKLAVRYLDDALRECQLVLVAEGQGRRTDPDLSRVARALVPDIEEISDAFAAAESTANPDGSIRLVGSMRASQAPMVADLQVQLVHLRILGRRGDLLLEGDPEVAPLLTWIWEEVSDQLAGRRPRACPLAPSPRSSA